MDWTEDDGALRRDISGQAGIDRERQPLKRDAAVGAEIRAVAQGVYPGVRPPAAHDPHRVAADLGERLFQRLRHAYLVFLQLPAVIAAAVIAQAQGDISHRHRL